LSSTPRSRTREDGGRFTATLQYKGHAVEVATGYDVAGDRYPFHVYMQRISGGSRTKVDCLPGHAVSKSDALHQGIEFAAAYIDAL
jgi:hypothetical protein